MEFYVYSRDLIARVRPHEVPHVIISITSAAGDVARFPTNGNSLAVLRLSFPDADAESERFPEAVLFGRAQADAIWALVDAHLGQIERIIVHCDAGMCRSPAVAAAISKVLTGDDTEFFRRYRPNMRVYRTLLEARLGAATSS